MLFSKFGFNSDQDITKYHVFVVTGKAANSNAMKFYRTTITIESLSPHFYPQIYMNKQEMSSLKFNWTEQNFPNLNKYDLQFGDNPFDQMGKTKFVYSFEGQTT